MKKKLLLQVLFAFLGVILFTSISRAQQSATPNEMPTALISPASPETPIEFKYNAAPAICYGLYGKNPFVNFTQSQLDLLASYEYPKFISQGVEMFEYDLMQFKNAKKAWDDANMYRKDEILTSLGLRQ